MENENSPTPEFRRAAVRLALTSGQTRQEISEDLGIGLSTLTRWLSRNIQGQPADSRYERGTGGGGRPSPQNSGRSNSAEARRQG